MKHRKNKLLFFSFLFLIAIVIPCVPANAIDITNSPVKANWLYVKAGTFGDSTPHSWEKNIHIETGGEDLSEFENLGMVSASDSAIIYKARAKFGFEVTAHTFVGVKDVYPNINLQKATKVPYFAILREYLGYSTSSVYSITYNSVDYGTTSQYHSYQGTIPITVGIKDLTSNTGSLMLNGERFSIPEYKADVIEAEVVHLRDGRVGEYTDRFEDLSGIENGTVTIVPMDDFSGEQTAMINYYNKYNLGWSAGSIQLGSTLQNSMVDGSQSGATFHNPDPAQNEEFTFPLFANIQPEVFEYVQYNTIRYAGIRYWTWGFWAGNIDTLVGPATRVLPKRVVAIHVNNYYLHWYFDVEVEFYATVPSTAELSEAVLSDPYLKSGEWVWDTSITGDINVSVPLTRDEIWDWLVNIFGEAGAVIFIIIIIVVIILVLYILYRIFIKKKQTMQSIIIKK